MVSSKSNEWSTPNYLFNKLDKEFQFDLDVAATGDNAKCEKFYDSESNGLSKDWHKESFTACWMNPPYGGNTRQWIKKAHLESTLGAIIVCLIVSSTDRSYWHDYIFPFASEIRFLRGRIAFGKAKSTAPFASAIVIFSPKNYHERQIIYYPTEKSHEQLRLLP